MPKVNIGDINIYYRVFRNGIEYQTLEEDVFAGHFLSEDGDIIAVDKPLKMAKDIEIKSVNHNVLDTSLPTRRFC